MSLATTFTKDKILELITNLQTSVEATYLKKGIAPGVVAGKVPTAVGDDTWTWQSPAGGSDGFGGTVMATPSTKTETSAGSSGKRLYLADWTFAPYKTGQPAPGMVDHPSTGTPGWGGFGFATAGWYSITAMIFLEFAAGSTPLPDHARFQFNAFNDSDGFIHDMACTPGETSSGDSRSDHGVQARLQSHIFYQPDDATSAGFVIKPFIYWDGDASAVSKYVYLYITKHG